MTWECELGPTRVVQGPDTLESLGELTRSIGGTRALLVTDQGLREAGHVATALSALNATSITTAVYDGVTANPTTRQVDEGLAAGREHEVDCIVGLGGGSSLDCAKGINFLLTNGGRMEDYWGSGKAQQPMLPSVGVPTTAGTGSEAQSYALISEDGTGVKMACGDKKAIFRAVVLDPVLAATAPREVAAISGIDAVSHAVESYVSLRANPISRTYAREAWRLLDSTLDRVLAAPDDLEAWERMQFGALLAGASIEQSMLGAAHACANPLTARFDVPHGIAVGLMLPHVVRFNASHVGKAYADLAGRLDERVIELRRTAKLPESLRDYSIPRDRFPVLAADAEKQWTAGFNPRPVGRRELLDLYEAAY